MDLDTDDEVLRTLADGHSMDYEKWPSLLSRLIPRLEKIVLHEFPVPSLPHPLLISSQTLPHSQIQSQPELPPTAESSSQNSSGSSQSTNKENAPPSAAEIPTGTLPPPILAMLNSITQTLETWFSKYPPHTVQRLAELILSPKQHYRTLPSYLHAVDRVVHVTSGAHTFPLPAAIPEASSATVLSNGASTADPLSVSWGNLTTTQQPSLGSDESLGGALLTPIVWLTRNGSSNSSHSPVEREVVTESTETIEGPNGPGGIETVTVSVNGISSSREAAVTPLSSNDGHNNGTSASLRADGGVTQGELLRQEQRAGVVPAAQLAGHKADTDGMGEEDELPHARGPEEIGMADLGPQWTGSVSERRGPGMGMQGIDIEAAVGRRTDAREERPGTPITSTPPKRDAEDFMGADEKRRKEEETEKADIELVDAGSGAEEATEPDDDDDDDGMNTDPDPNPTTTTTT